MYLLVGKAITFVYKEELEELPDPRYRGAIFGFITGGMFKCLNGWKPAMFSATIGIFVGYTFNKFWSSKLDQREIIQ